MNFELIAIAIFMAIILAYSIKWFDEVQRALHYSIIIFILAMMASMFVGAVIYFLSPSFQTLWIAVGFNQLIMWIAAIPIISSLIGEEPNKKVNQKNYPLLIFLVLINEFFMGWTFNLITQPISANLELMLSSPITLFSNVINSYWFIFIMGGEMLFTIYLLRKNTDKFFIILIAFQSVIMFLTPTAVNDSNWVYFSSILGSIVMSILFVIIFNYIFKNREINEKISSYLLILLSIYAIMMGGLFGWVINGNGLIVAITIIAEMSLYFYYLLKRNEINTAKKFSWIVKPNWVFYIILLTYISGFFMGGLMDLVIYGQDFLNSINFAPISGQFHITVVNSIYNFVRFFIAIIDSAWYFFMMGIQMGALVILRIKYVRELETKIRLALIVIAYFVFWVYFSNFFFNEDTLPYIPFIGYLHGVGTAGPVAPSFLIALALTYLLAGILSLLFGARWLCSVTCHISLMYQGVFFDNLKQYNRTSKIGRKFLTSRINNTYKVIANITWISIITASIISYLNSIGYINVSLYGEDIVNFATEFYFHFLWQFLFLLIPFVGTYSCVTTGSCHYGLFAQYLSKLGFWKLKVKDPEICLKCPTKDCAKACPVGLTDLPASFIASGEFKSHKCIGVGNCVSACPYKNEYFYDVRTWIRDKIKLR